LGGVSTEKDDRLVVLAQEY